MTEVITRPIFYLTIYKICSYMTPIYFPIESIHEYTINDNSLYNILFDQKNPIILLESGQVPILLWLCLLKIFSFRIFLSCKAHVTGWIDEFWSFLIYFSTNKLDDNRRDHEGNYPVKCRLPIHFIYLLVLNVLSLSPAVEGTYYAKPKKLWFKHHQFCDLFFGP